MAATTTDVREWWNTAHPDRPLSGRGRISDEARAEYDAAHPGEQAGQYDGVTEADFSLPEPKVVPPEPQRPVRPPRTGRAPVTGRLRGWFTGQPAGTSKPKGPKPKRVPVVSFVQHWWEDMAWSAKPIPPLQKLLYAQAPFAGQVMEEAVRGTVADRVLQPAARAEAKGQAIYGLAGPPFFLMAALASAPPPGEDMSPAHRMAVTGLRHSLVSMSRAAALDFDGIMERAEETAAQEEAVDRFMAWLFAVPVTVVTDMPGPTVKEEAREQAADLFAPGAPEEKPPRRARGTNARPHPPADGQWNEAGAVAAARAAGPIGAGDRPQ